LKRHRRRGGKRPVDLVRLARIAISPVLGKGPAEFEGLLRIRSLIFSEINELAGFLFLSLRPWADPRGDDKAIAE
jgi:hypothetical protein